MANGVLGMEMLVASGGTYPARGPDGMAVYTLGMIQSYAGMRPVLGAAEARGQMVQVQSAEALFSVFGPVYGGGSSSFAYPNLAGRVAVGAGTGVPVGQSQPGGLAMTYAIAVTPGGSAPMLGSLAIFGGTYAPGGWMPCDGTLLSIAEYTELFSVLGAHFGGDGEASFALPNLMGAAPVGVGQGPGLGPVQLGQQVPGAVPGLGLTYLIATQGLYPVPDGDGSFPATQPYLGQVVAYGGSSIPSGWTACNGQILPIAQNMQLYNLIGSQYGGDGTSNFALPDLRGLMAGLRG